MNAEPEPATSTHHSVAFEGCASRVAFQIGAAVILQRSGLNPPVLAGASSGSIVAACWAAGLLDALHDTWAERAEATRVFEPRRLLRGRWPGRMSHVLRDNLHELATFTLADLPRLRVAVTRLGLRGPRQVILANDPHIRVLDAVLASCTLPGPYSRPVWLQRRFAMDGAWMERTPFAALPPGPALAVISNPDGHLLRGWPRVTLAEPWPGLEVLAPATELPLSGFSFDGPSTRQAMAMGRAAARRYLDGPK